MHDNQYLTSIKSISSRDIHIMYNILCGNCHPNKQVLCEEYRPQ